MICMCKILKKEKFQNINYKNILDILLLHALFYCKYFLIISGIIFGNF